MSRIRLPDGVPSDNQNSSGQKSNWRAKTHARAEHSAAREAARVGEHEGRDFIAPNTATPDFAIPADNKPCMPGADAVDAPFFARPPDLAPHFTTVIIETDDDDEEDDDDDEEENGLVHGPHPPAPFLILVAIGLLLIALAAFIVSRNEEPGVPDCSGQPEWNQYNCRAD